MEKCYFQYHQQMKETRLDETDNRLVDIYINICLKLPYKWKIQTLEGVWTETQSTTYVARQKKPVFVLQKVFKSTKSSCICTGRRVSGFFWPVQRCHCQLAARGKKLVSCLEGCRLWVLDQAELAPQPMPAVPEPDSVSALIRYRTWSPWGGDWLSCICTGRRVGMHGLHGRVQRRDRQLAALRREKIVSCLDDIRPLCLWARPNRRSQLV